jgi:hypothetical protein
MHAAVRHVSPLTGSAGTNRRSAARFRLASILTPFSRCLRATDRLAGRKAKVLGQSSLLLRSISALRARVYWSGSHFGCETDRNHPLVLLASGGINRSLVGNKAMKLSADATANSRSVSFHHGSNCFGAANAQGPAPSPLISLPSPPPTNVAAVAQPSPPPALTKSDFETFLDGLIPSQLQNRDIAGAVVSVVKDGQVLFAKGYGYADFTAKKPVLADQTLFRPGSISKLFTATAVMQLVEQGKLDLDRDVNEYLDFAIPKTYPEPVTLRRLLTHTAGFEETLKNLFAAHESDMKPLRTYLVNQIAAHFPTGKVVVFNYGFTLRIHRRASERRNSALPTVTF